MGKTLTYIGLGLGGFAVISAVTVFSGGKYTGTETAIPKNTPTPPVPLGSESGGLTPLEQSYVAPDGTIGWIKVEIGNEPITKVIVTDANGNEICRGFQFTPAMTEYNNKYDTSTDGVADNRTRVTEAGIIEKFCGIDGYLFYKTPDTSNMFQGSIPDVDLLAHLLLNSKPEIFGYSRIPETNELIPRVVWVLPDESQLLDAA